MEKKTLAVQTIIRRRFVMLWAILALALGTASAQAATFKVVVTPGTTPNPVNPNTAVSQKFTASVSGVLASGQEVQIVGQSVNWHWYIAPTQDDTTDKITYNSSSTAAQTNPSTGWGTATAVGTSTNSLNSTGTLSVNISQLGY